MALPMPANTTCDVYRALNAPPAAPDVNKVSCYLNPRGQSTLTSENYTHVLYVDWRTDLRDGYIASSMTGDLNKADSVYIPDKNGTQFIVILVRRYARGTPLDHKEALLLRITPAANQWPTNNL